MRRNPTRSAHARSSDRSWPTVATPGKWSAATVSRHDHTAAGRLRGWQLAWHGATIRRTSSGRPRSTTPMSGGALNQGAGMIGVTNVFSVGTVDPVAVRTSSARRPGDGTGPPGGRWIYSASNVIVKPAGSEIQGREAVLDRRGVDPRQSPAARMALAAPAAAEAGWAAAWSAAGRKCLSPHAGAACVFTRKDTVSPATLPAEGVAPPGETLGYPSRATYPA